MEINSILFVIIISVIMGLLTGVFIVFLDKLGEIKYNVSRSVPQYHYEWSDKMKDLFKNVITLDGGKSFKGCTELSNVPKLSKENPDNHYSMLFKGCTELKNIPETPTEMLDKYMVKPEEIIQALTEIEIRRIEDNKSRLEKFIDKINYHATERLLRKKS